MVPDPNGRWCRADEGWQDISTAPRGECVMLWRPTCNLTWTQIVTGKYNDDRYAKNPAPYWGHDLERIEGKRSTRVHQPTHWRPLPAPPNPKEADHA
ncbi:DUF551 domain-containing protein [Paracoccus yeei]|uniref:DUF551 domain-containing protein n=1 Tax=Paracoccus yeei TaxID=147645 RepID=UPI001D662E0A|nr:DUF551 domain-containing protein [Paracoccus yeei]